MFQDGAAQEWLNDKASDYSVAKRVLFDYHPLEPEMWLSLAGQYFPHCYYGGSIYPIVAPFPGMPQKPDFVNRYEDCTWRSENMNLLDFLRKSNEQGEIARWIKEEHMTHVVAVAFDALGKPKHISDICIPYM